MIVMNGDAEYFYQNLNFKRTIHEVEVKIICLMLESFDEFP
jgi:hypothetical protein